MRPGVRWWLFGGLAYLGWLLITFPLGPVLSALQSAGVGVQLQGASGSLWRGEASRLQVPAARLSLANVQWRFTPLALLHGRVGFTVSFKDAGDALIGQVAVSPSGQAQLEGVSGKLAAARLIPLLPMPLGLEGDLVLDDVAVTLEDGRPTAAAGAARWVDARIASPFVLELGMVDLELAGTATGWRGTYTGQGAAGDLNGSIEAGADGRYHTDTAIVPRDGNVAGFLEGMGYQPANGAYRFVYEGAF